MIEQGFRAKDYVDNDVQHEAKPQGLNLLELQPLPGSAGSLPASSFREANIGFPNDAKMDAAKEASKEASKDTTGGKGEDFWGVHVDPNDLHTGRRALGQNLVDKLKDWDYLIEHKNDLKHGLERAYSHMTPDAFKKFVKELNEKSAGKIYLEEGNGLLGSLNPLNPPGDQVVRVYLKRGALLSDDNIMDSRRQTSSPVYTSGKPFDSRK